VSVFTLAHLSDIHLGPMPRARRRELVGKRMLGYVNWHRGRKLVHRRDILDLLTRDIAERRPDHIAVTGDLVNIGLPGEFLMAAEWLHELGSPDRVTAIPGNHDAYVRLHPEHGTAHWLPYLRSNESGEALLRTPATGFPFIRRFGDVVLVALSSAIPTLPFIAAGRIGSAQRALLGLALEELGRLGLFRVVLIHHPPLPGVVGWRRGLRDATAVTQILKEKGAELVLHGHNHEQTVIELETTSGNAIVIGVPSASEAVSGRIPAARYNEYRIAKVDVGWQCEMTGYAVAETGLHVVECERKLLRQR
jgi:3',5'-cyclic AMP phosphodiesterase CpdA